MKVNLQITKKARVEMLPLIDIVFLLLVFFIYAMLSMAVHRGMPVTLPISSTAKIDKKLILSVTIDENGNIFLDKENVGIDLLKDLLLKRVQDRLGKGVLLFADRDTPYQTLFRVMDQIRMAGISDISLQAEAKE